MVAVLRPDTVAQAREAVRDQPGTLAVTGAGTGQQWGGPLQPVDATLDVTGLDRLVSYQPADLTVAVQAGMPLARLQELLAEQGQRVALDAARVAAGATVGGLLATGDAGPARLAYGSLRDLVIGATLLLADGTLARSGGQVIKNVAGYDLAKLCHGSLGTLAVVVELVLRLHPLPAATGTLVVPCDLPAATALAGRLLAAALEPVAVRWCRDQLLVRFDGGADGLAGRARQARQLAGEQLVGAEPSWQEPGDDGWRTAAAVSTGRAGDTVLRVGTLPSLAPWLGQRVAALAGTGPVTATLCSDLLVGVHDLRLRGGDAADHAAVAGQVRAEVAARGGTTMVCRWTDGLAAHLPAWGDPPAAVAVLRAVKRAFDPGGRLGPGRFAPWF